jgi:hypothetical protein
MPHGPSLPPPPPASILRERTYRSMSHEEHVPYEKGPFWSSHPHPPPPPPPPQVRYPPPSATQQRIPPPQEFSSMSSESQSYPPYSYPNSNPNSNIRFNHQHSTNSSSHWYSRESGDSMSLKSWEQSPYPTPPTGPYFGQHASYEHEKQNYHHHQQQHPYHLQHQQQHYTSRHAAPSGDEYGGPPSQTMHSRPYIPMNTEAHSESYYHHHQNSAAKYPPPEVMQQQPPNSEHAPPYPHPHHSPSSRLPFRTHTSQGRTPPIQFRAPSYNEPTSTSLNKGANSAQTHFSQQYQGDTTVKSTVNDDEDAIARATREDKKKTGDALSMLAKVSFAMTDPEDPKTSSEGKSSSPITPEKVSALRNSISDEASNGVDVSSPEKQLPQTVERSSVYPAQYAVEPPNEESYQSPSRPDGSFPQSSSQHRFHDSPEVVTLWTPKSQYEESSQTWLQSRQHPPHRSIITPTYNNHAPAYYDGPPTYRAPNGAPNYRHHYPAAQPPSMSSRQHHHYYGGNGHGPQHEPPTPPQRGGSWEDIRGNEFHNSGPRIAPYTYVQQQPTQGQTTILRKKFSWKHFPEVRMESMHCTQTSYYFYSYHCYHISMLA